MNDDELTICDGCADEILLLESETINGMVFCSECAADERAEMEDESDE